MDEEFIRFEEELKIAILTSKSPNDQLITSVVPAISDRLCALEQKVSLSVRGTDVVTRQLGLIESKLDVTSSKSDNISLALQNAVLGTLGHLGDAVTVIRDVTRDESEMFAEDVVTDSGPSNVQSSIPEFAMSRKTGDISTLWKEFTEGINGQPPIRTLERQYGTSWRKRSSETKFFTKRLPLLIEIQRRVDSDEEAHVAIQSLENERINNNLTFHQFLRYIRDKTK